MVLIFRTYKCRLAGLQNLFRQQYSKIGNTREQVFHAWRSFHFDENTERLRCIYDTYKTGSYTFRLWRNHKF